MTEEDFTEQLESGHERAWLEFKGPGPISNRNLVAQVVRAILAMANRRDGGIVIVGVEDNQGEINPVGLDDADLGGWTNDSIADQIARYADPNVDFELEIKAYNGRSFVVIEVEEFSMIPVLCKRAYGNVLRDGACYVRTFRKPETSEIPSQTEMRELLGRAIDKGISGYLARARRIGLYVPPPEAQLGDRELFERQRGGLE